MYIKKFIYFILIIIFLSNLAYSPTISRGYQHDLDINISPNGNSLIFNLNLPSSSSNYHIKRRDINSQTWTDTLVSDSGVLSTYEDSSINISQMYEYKIDTGAAISYSISGINVSPSHFKGKIILLIHGNQTDSLSEEIIELKLDLVGDGYDVIEKIITTETIEEIKDYIIEINSSVEDLSSIYLLGHIPVPQSGRIYPDAHTNHQGAWTADSYYAQLNDVWTDYSINYTASNERLTNIPGDGKFDRSTHSTPIDLMQGRVDFYDMPQFSKNETELLRQYLDRANNFKNNKFYPEKKILVKEGFASFAEGFSQTGYRTSVLFGSDKITTSGNWNISRINSYIFGYGAGGGSYTGAGGVGTTTDFANNAHYVVFNAIFGSYFGDWDVRNNFLRAPLAGEGYALTNAWSGRPHWFFHHLGLGLPVGFSAKRSIYYPYSNSYDTPGTNYNIGQIHSSLLGDPTLRLEYLSPVTNLDLTNVDNNVLISWDNNNSNLGYYVYGSKDKYKNYNLLNSEYITSNNFTDNLNYKYYMVKPVSLSTTASGSYFNLGIGKIVEYTDTTQPILYIISPNNNEILNDTKLNLNLNSSEFIFGNISIDNINYSFESNGSNYENEFTNLFDGDYELKIYYFDSNYNSNFIKQNFSINLTKSEYVNSSFENTSKEIHRLTYNFEIEFSTPLTNLTILLNDTEPDMELNLSNRIISGKLYLPEFSTYNLTLIYEDKFGYNGSKNIVFDANNNALRRDRDGDGIMDKPGMGIYIDKIQGDKSFISTNINFNLYINSSENMSVQYNSTYPINFKRNGRDFLNFNFNFTNKSIDFTKMRILRNKINTSYLFSNIPQFGTKTINIELPSIGFTSICINDNEIKNFFSNNISCEGVNYTFISDINSYNDSNYNLTLNNTNLKIEGLRHSLVTLICTENWSCGDWSTCDGSSKTRTCTDNNICGTYKDEPEEITSCSISESTSSNSGSSSSSSPNLPDDENENTESTVNKFTIINSNASCTSDIVEYPWEDCINGTQTRTIVDINSCSTPKDEVRVCKDLIILYNLVEIEKDDSGKYFATLDNTNLNFLILDKKFNKDKFAFFDTNSSTEYLATFDYESDGYFFYKIEKLVSLNKEIFTIENQESITNIFSYLLIICIILFFSLFVFLHIHKSIKNKNLIKTNFGYDDDTFNSLKEYIESNIKLYPRNDIISMLRKSGWSEEVISYLFKLKK